MVLTSSNYDYDYDTVQPCFFLEDEEDFYPPPRSQLLPGPGEDIWKKFELLPTPPLSPSRRPSLPDAPLSAAAHLEAVSELLDEARGPPAALLQSFIIQDCMWSSSFAAATKLERAVSERLAWLRCRRDSTSTSSTSTSSTSTTSTSSTSTSSTTSTTSTTSTSTDRAAGRQVGAAYLQDLHPAATHCIDPSVVFPCTRLSERSGDGPEAEAAPASELCLDTPPLSSSDSESEEEEEEEEEGEEEEGEDEEIDVVTVERRKAPQRLDASPLVLKRSHINVHQHNYAAQQPAVKRVRSEAAGPAPRPSGGASGCSSPRSDGEDGDRRRTHNVLERQRRNELKRSFLALRDELPALARNDKAAKVLILRTAADVVARAGEDERRLLAAKEQLLRRSRELRRRLEQLRTLS